MSHDDYEDEVTASRAAVASILSDVADGIRAGAVQLSEEEDGVNVEIPDELTLEIELETDDGETSLELELEWPAAAPASPSNTTAEGDEEEPAVAADATNAGRPMARFEVYRARDEEWRWRLRHRNGNIIATSGEGYTRKQNALKGLRSVIANSADATVTEDFTG